MRRALAALFITSMLFVGAAVAPAAAQSEDPDAEFTADETAGDIERIRTALYVIAAVTGGLLVIYVWHTNPRRRMDVAVRRRAAREQEQLDSLDDAFVLPGDVASEVEDESADACGGTHTVKGTVCISPGTSSTLRRALTAVQCGGGLSSTSARRS